VGARVTGEPADGKAVAIPEQWSSGPQHAATQSVGMFLRRLRETQEGTVQIARIGVRLHGSYPLQP